MSRLLKYPFGIRFKLVFFSGFLLFIPWLGYKYILEMENILQEAQEQTILGTAQALATALNERPELFDEGSFTPATPGKDLYLYPIFYPLTFNDNGVLDWQDYQQYEVQYGAANAIRFQSTPDSVITNNTDFNSDSTIGSEAGSEFNSEPEVLVSQEYIHNDESLSFKSMVGEHNNYLYAYFKVTDDKVVYRNEESLRVYGNDFLQILLETEDKAFRRYIMAPYRPGVIDPYLVNEDFSNPIYDREVGISGKWTATNIGYEIELRIPLDMRINKLGFAIYDVDDPDTKTITSFVPTSGVSGPEDLGSLQIPQPEIDRIVAGMGHSSSRIQVVDRGGRVLLVVGDIQSATGLALGDRAYTAKVNKYWRYIEDNLLLPLYYQILTKPSNDFIDELYSGGTIEGAHIFSALTGEPQIQFRSIPDTQTRILEAAHPILANGEVMGAVVVDQNMNGIRTFRNEALESLFNMILAVLVLVTVGPFLFASSISYRIGSLRNQAEKIIDESGRLQNTIVASNSSDEIGDLSRSFSSIVERLGQYTHYLENMSSRLSHELRTPVSVVRSSLENLSLVSQSKDSEVYIERAEEGIKRLTLILANMSEATRLEQMLQSSEKEKIDLAKVVNGCTEGYKLAYPEVSFDVDISEESVIIHGVPEYIAQLMDKLIANAVEFSYEGKMIAVFCRTIKDQAILRISNSGPYLPEEMKDRLFDSMISVRPQEKQKQPHLGIGLHIARLITEFHQGQIKADNLDEEEGVSITLAIPLFSG